MIGEQNLNVQTLPLKFAPFLLGLCLSVMYDCIHSAMSKQTKKYKNLHLDMLFTKEPTGRVLVRRLRSLMSRVGEFIITIEVAVVNVIFHKALH